MRSLLLLATLGALVTATHVLAAPNGASQRLPRATPAGQTAIWGHAKTLTRTGDHYLLGFDPGILLRGVTAERAALEEHRLERRSEQSLRARRGTPVAHLRRPASRSDHRPDA